MHNSEASNQDSDRPQPGNPLHERTNTWLIVQKLEQAINRLLARQGHVTTLSLISGTMLLGDALLQYGRPSAIPAHYWALLDSPVHGLLALLVVSPLFRHPFFQRKLLGWLTVAALTAVFIDLDHVIAARSFSLIEITTLPNRPMIHSLLFASLFGLVALLLTRRPLAGWLIFAVLASHVLRDASTGATYFLWPLSVDQLPIPAYYASQILLYLLSYLFATRRVD
jgi:hypothetical protein